MENHQGKGIAFRKFTWIIQDFSKKNPKKLRSEAFEVGGCKWRILVHPIGKGVEHLSLFLKLADSLPSYGWSKHAYFTLALINQMDSKNSILKETQQKFNARYSGWGASFVSLSDFYNTTKGYLVNNACIIEAQVSISDVPFKVNQDNLTKSVTQIHDDESKCDEAAQKIMAESIQLEDQSIDSSDGTTRSPFHEPIWSQEDRAIIGDGTSSSKQVHNVPTAPPLYPSLYDEPEQEMPLSPLGKLIDFRSLGPEEVALVPLLEQVCSWHPSLLESQRKRSPKFIHLSFMALGQVLYFLKMMKVKDMREEAAHNHLQNLWEELQYFKFDLTWLEPHVESALGMKAYMEREEQVRKLKDEVAALEIETKKLRRNLAVAEVDLNIEKRHLAEEEKGFEEIDMDAQLGYGIF